KDVALGLGLALQDARDDVLLVHRGGDVGDAELLRHGEEVLRLRLVQLGDRVVLASRCSRWRLTALRGLSGVCTRWGWGRVVGGGLRGLFWVFHGVWCFSLGVVLGREISCSLGPGAHLCARTGVRKMEKVAT